MSVLRSSIHSKSVLVRKDSALSLLSKSIEAKVCECYFQSKRATILVRQLSMSTTNSSKVPVTVAGRQYRAVKEGLAQILAPYQEVKSDPIRTKTTKQSRPHNNDEGNQAVFYNPIQQYNRDLSVLAIRTYGEGAVIEKGERRERKQKANHPKAKHNKTSQPNGKKRKVSEIGNSEGSETEKRAKVDEDDDESVLEIQQLEPKTTSASTDNTVLQTNTADGTGPPCPQKQVPFTILDALSASGLRAIRYAKEIPFATNIVANDLSPEAVKSIELNIDHNKVKGKVHSNVGDARAYMYSKVGNENQHPSESYVHRFDVIDLDPYGTAAPFLDAALQALIDGGLLCVTCTDAGVFASNGYPEKGYALYGGMTMKGSHSHEAGLRLILHAVASSAAKYGIAIEPLLSLSIDFYARLFIRVHKKQHEVKLLSGTTMFTYSCDYGCGAVNTQSLGRNQIKQDKNGNDFFKYGYAQAPNVVKLCEHCGSKMHLGGPMWAGPLHNPYFVQRMLDQVSDLDPTIYGTTDRMLGMLTLALEENLTLEASNSESSPDTPAEGLTTTTSFNSCIIPRVPPQTIDQTPFFFIPSNLAKILHCVTPPEDPFRGAIRRLGYKVTRSHCKPFSFKTNAPWTVIWELMREWVRQEAPLKNGKLLPGSPGWKIMSRTRETETKKVDDLLQELKKNIENGVHGKEETQRLLESALYRLQHGDEHPTLDASGSDSTDQPKEGDTASQDISRREIVFDAQLGKEKPRGRLVRYQFNPRAHWGPMSRAGGLG